MHSHLAPISEEQSGVKPDDLDGYSLECIADENVEDASGAEVPLKHRRVNNYVGHFCILSIC